MDMALVEVCTRIYELNVDNIHQYHHTVHCSVAHTTIILIVNVTRQLEANLPHEEFFELGSTSAISSSSLARMSR